MSIIRADQLSNPLNITGSLLGTASTASYVQAANVAGLSLNQITTGSITASVNVGTDTFNIVSGSSTFMYISSSSQVGIGTSTPSAKLDISASANNTFRISGIQTTTTYNNLISITGSTYSGTPVFNFGVTAVDATLYMRGSGDAQPLTIKTSYQDTITSNRDLYVISPTTFIVSQSSGGVDAFRVTNPTSVRFRVNSSGNTEITGSATITDVLVLPYQNGLPSGKPTGSIALSGSGTTFVGMYMYNGTSWIKLSI